MTEVKRHTPRIDWMTLSWSHDIDLLINQGAHIKFLKNLFHFEDFMEIIQHNQLVLNGDDIYICFRPRLIYIQFRGSFFYQFDSYYSIIKSFAKKINDEFNAIESSAFYRSLLISRLDIAVDYESVTPEFFLADFTAKNRVFFSYMKQVYERKNICETIYLNSSKWKLRFYRKDLEIKNEKNETKRKYFFENFGESNIVTRFELQLNESKNLKDETFLFYSASFVEQEFIQYALANFYNKHRIRIIQKSKNTSKWPECKKWKSFFLLSENYLYTPNVSGIQTNELKLSENRGSYTKALNRIVEHAHEERIRRENSHLRNTDPIQKEKEKAVLNQQEHRIDQQNSDLDLDNDIRNAFFNLKQRLDDQARKLELTNKYFLRLTETELDLVEGDGSTGDEGQSPEEFGGDPANSGTKSAA